MDFFRRDFQDGICISHVVYGKTYGICNGVCLITNGEGLIGYGPVVAASHPFYLSGPTLNSNVEDLAAVVDGFMENKIFEIHCSHTSHSIRVSINHFQLSAQSVTLRCATDTCE